MINFKDAKVVIETNENIKYEISTIIDQDETSITVSFFSMDYLSSIERRYKIPEAFENRVIYLNGGLNDVLLEYYAAKKKLDAIVFSIKTLELDKDDEAYKALDKKKDDIEFEVKEKERAFLDAAYIAAPEWHYIERDTKEMNDRLMTLVSEIERTLKLKEKLDTYSGLKLKKYKELQREYDNTYHSANTGIVGLREDELKIKNTYREMGVFYPRKYDSLNYGSIEKLKETLLKLRKYVKKINLGNSIINMPPGFNIESSNDDDYYCIDENDFIIHIYKGINSLLNKIEKGDEDLEVINCDDGDKIIYYSTFASFNTIFNKQYDYPLGKPYYLEEIRLANGNVYSVEITKDGQITDNKKVDNQLFEINSLLHTGGFNRRNLE